MKPLFLIPPLLLAASGLVAQSEVLAPLPETPLPAGVSVTFTIDGQDLVGQTVDFIEATRREILVAQYAITDPRVIKALVQASQRGVVVAVLLDANPAIRNYDTPRFLRSQGIPVILAKRGLNGDGWYNQKFLVMDRNTVLFGTLDLTTSAQRNHETLLAVSNPGLASRFYNTWLKEAGEGKQL